MKAILVLYDTLRKSALPPYGAKDIHAPNFTRLAERTTRFETNFVGSLPCMPARRELHTGRYNFLHRGWGPIEPYDDSMPEQLKKNGIHSHLISDHYHYWNDGGATYHTRYSTWENVRGQEHDAWKAYLGEVDYPVFEMHGRKSGNRQNYVNRMYMPEEKDFPLTRTFDLGIEFLDTNHAHDNWFLQIETASPHEPFYSHKKYRDMYPAPKSGSVTDWPHAGATSMTPDEEEDAKNDYRAMVSMCDANLGKVLDAMDSYDLWKDTMLIVTTDHGTLMGEQGQWGKNVQPPFNSVSNTPLFIWDPRTGEKGGCFDGLTQMIDLAPTVLDFFGQEIPPDVQGRPIREYMAGAKREGGLFGNNGGYTCCTDGRYIYMRAAANENNEPLYTYFQMPLGIIGMFSMEEMKQAEFCEPFSFTKGSRLLRIPAGMMGKYMGRSMQGWGSLLYDTQGDPGQQNKLDDPETEQRMIRLLVKLMKENDAPAEQYERLGLGDYI